MKSLLASYPEGQNWKVLHVLNVFQLTVNSEQWYDNIVIMAGQHLWESSSCWRAPILFMQKGPRKHIRGQGVNYGGGWYASSWNVLKSIPLKRLKMSQNVINHSEIKSNLYEQKGTSFEILKCYHAVIAIQHWVLMLANRSATNSFAIRFSLSAITVLMESCQIGEPFYCLCFREAMF